MLEQVWYISHVKDIQAWINNFVVTALFAFTLIAAWRRRDWAAAKETLVCMLLLGWMIWIVLGSYLVQRAFGSGAGIAWFVGWFVAGVALIHFGEG